MIRAVFPASGNNCGQLAQAYFSRFYSPTMALKFWSIGDTLAGNTAPQEAEINVAASMPLTAHRRPLP